MTFAPHSAIDTGAAFPLMPAWVTAMRAETLEDAAFSSGAALSHLHLVLRRPDLPQALLRDRLALRAASASVAFSGRPERAGELRDMVHFLRAGDRPGPAGETCLSWRRATERKLSVAVLCRALPGLGEGRIADWLGSGQGAPVRRAAMVLERVLSEAPHLELPGLITADAALAQALGWDHLVPLLAGGLKRAALRQRGDALHLSCHRALVSSAAEAVRLAAELARRTAHLRAVAPRLRARGADQAVEMFLTQDALAPAALPLPDRAARRLCDRLVDLGALREMTGRDSFRLYGV